MEVIVAGSNNDSSFAVADFTNPGTPTNVVTAAPFLGGCMVDASATLAAVGNFNGGQIAIFDISNPAAPVQKSMISTILGGIGAISIDGNRVLAGEHAGLRATLIDITNPSSPSVVSTHNTGISSISSIALSGNKAVVAGPNDLAFSVVDYTVPASPTHVKFLSGTGGVFFNGPMAADLDGNRAAIADMGGGTVHFFDISGAAPNRLGVRNTTQQGVSSLSISGSTVAAASTNNVAISLVSFASPNAPTETDLNTTGLNGGATVKLAGARMAAGDVLGTEVALFNVAGTTATSLGKVNTTLPSIATIAFTSFAAQAPQPQISSNLPQLAFGTVHVNVGKMLPVTLKNTGNASLSITNLHCTAPQYVPVPAGTVTIAAGGTRVVNVTFTPGSAASFPASLTMSTNDPAHATFSVPMTGSGGLPHMVLPGPLDLGGVAVCQTHVANCTIGNNGTVDLTLTQIATSGAPFSEGAPATVVVPAGGSGSIPVTFAPSAVGQAAGTLTLHSDDPTQPTASVALKGLGTPEPPPQISVVPAAINFQAVPLQYFVGIAVTVANVGPCELLHATLTVSGAAFVLTTGNPTTLPVNNVPLPATVQPNTSQSFTVVFAPTALGAANGTLTITSDDPAHPTVTVPLTGTGTVVAPAAIELVLDRSGSMAATVPGGTRMTALQSAVAMFSDLLIPSTGFSMGSTQFDDQVATLTALADFDAAQQGTIKTDANTLSPRNMTSIGGGLALAQTNLTASAQPRKVAIVFTDGWENTAPMIAGVKQGIVNAGTEVYAVGLGDPAFLSVAALDDLATSSNGHFFQTTDALVLRKQFVEVLADAFRQNMAADPILLLQQGVQVTFPVDITQCESRISFVLLWEDPAAQIQLTVRAPDGTTFTPSAPATNRLVRYVQRPGYRFYQIALPPGPNATIGPKQLGTWTMNINPVSLPGGTARAAPNVLVESELRMTALVSAPSVVDPMRLRVRIDDHGKVVQGAKVRVKLTSPVQSLAQISTPLVHARALAADKHPIPPALQNPTKTTSADFEAKFNEREYVLQLPPPKIDGVYHAEVTATGQACGGSFQRYWSTSFYVGRGRKPVG